MNSDRDRDDAVRKSAEGQEPTRQERASPESAPEGRVVSRDGAPPVQLLGADDRPDPVALLARVLRSGDPALVVATCWRLWHRDLLRRVLYSGVPPEHAEDVLQDVFALLARDYQRVRSHRLRGWLGTMVDFECRRWFQDRRRSRRNRQVAAERVEPPEYNREAAHPETSMDRRRDLDVAFAFIRDLEPEDAFVLEASLYHQLAAAEVAAGLAERFQLVLSAAAIRQRRSLLRRQLASQIRQKRRGGRFDGDLP